MSVRRRADHSTTLFLQRTIAAQIHGLAFLLVCLGMALLLPKAAIAGEEHFWACLIFLVTGLLLFLTSSLYHLLHDGFHISSGLENLFEDLDHYCIYLFIAGTYTPVLMNAVEDPWRTYLLIAIWVIAICGIIYTKLKPILFPALRSRGVYTTLFVVMGLLIVVRAEEIFTRLTPMQLTLACGGVAAYWLGAIGYATRLPVLFTGVFGYHELWHLMVLLGGTFHFLLICSFYN